MSQEINLINPGLRRQRDWLAFGSVALGTLAALVLTAGAYAYARSADASARARLVSVQAKLAGLQQEVQAAQAALAARTPDAALETERQQLAAALKQRGDVLQLAEGLASQEGGEVAEVMRGFSRQRMDGVWLTAFSIGANGIDIRGRLLDPALLPGYIRRLNGEPAFRGRSFAALDMHGVVPETAQPGSAAAGSPVLPAAAKPAPPSRFTEFALRATLVGNPAAGGKE